MSLITTSQQPLATIKQPHGEQPFWTGVGSRECPHTAFMLGIRVGKLMRRYALDMGGGDAIGMDKAFITGMNDWNRIHAYSVKPKEHFIDGTQCERFEEAMAIAKSLHPNWKACTPWARSLHARNVFQVLGPNINEPSEFVVFWAEPQGRNTHEVKGGTNTAVKVAYEWDIPLYNLYYPETFSRLVEAVHRYPLFSDMVA